MHKLTRTTEPAELIQARVKKLPDWDSFPRSEKKAVRDELLLMQNFRCAYCERKLHDVSSENENKWDGHIEHFRRKDQHFHPELTFVWENLFYSCLTKATCGKHKDDYVYSKEQYALLIDPCKENPEDFLFFDDRGKISIRTGLSEENKKRAVFTIKAFHLDDPVLTKERESHLKKHEWVKTYPVEFINEYLKSISDDPFVTNIFHYFGRRVVS